jgi:hypothetical protein
MKNDKNYRLRHLQTIENIKQAQKLQARSAGRIYQVPVVVHVMNKGEAVGEGTNISDADVRAGIQYLNNYWRKVSGTYGDGNGIDMEIEFALAVQDENGNCTNGIVRKDMSAVTSYVNNGVNGDNSDGIPDHDPDEAVNSLKEYSVWDPTKYYNVWLVDEIDNNNCFSGNSFTAGYAYYAAEHGQAWDGSVVLICSYLDESNSTWAHEMGHAFNLPHTFEGDQEGTVCPTDLPSEIINNVIVKHGDGIDDTPKHIRTMSINGLYQDCGNSDVNLCDPDFNVRMSPNHTSNGTHQDHMHNYMDYSDCTSEFTYGQKAVSKSALTNERASYLPENGNTALLPPMTAMVDFSASAAVVCHGSSMTFTDQSTCIPNTYTNTPIDGITFNWIFDNGVKTYVSTDQNPTITFDNPGTYDVTFEVTNSQGITSLTKSKSITVTESVTAGCSSSSLNINGDFGCGVTNISFNTLNHSTSIFIPESSMQDFTCSKNTVVTIGTAYDLSATYKALNNFNQFLEVWIDWDNSGTFETFNNNGTNERVLTDNIVAASTGTPSTTVTPPATAALNTLLRMRVISDANGAPVVCGEGFIQRADDYGILVKGLVQGCTDVNACNYNATAIDDDASCVLTTGCETCSGATDGTGTVEDNDTDNDGVCNEIEVAGCTDSDACNYNSSATDVGTCTYSIGLDACASCSGATDGTGTVEDNDADDDGVCNADEIEGCTDATACNYDATPTTDTNNSLCTYPTQAYLDCSGACVNDTDGDGVCNEIEVAGCTDSDACNYNSSATDVGTCTYSIDLDACASCSGATDGTGTVVDNDLDDDGVCNADEIEGCKDENACNYDANATDDDGSCYDTILPLVENYSYDYQMVTVNADIANVTYEWYYGGVLLTESSSELIPTENGEYSVVVTDNDNQACSVTKSFTVAAIGLVELEDLGIKLYPNPTTDQLYLVADNSYDILNVEVMNIMGTVLSERELRNIRSNDVIEFNIKDLSTGLYLLKLSTNTQWITIPWMKQ